MFGANLLQNVFAVNLRFSRNVRRALLDRYGPLLRPEVQADLEHLAVETSRKKSLEIEYQLEEQRRRQRTVRFHILRRKYVAHPRDVQVNLFVKNHMQFLHKNYPSRWNVSMLAQSFEQSEENVRLILQQRATRRLRVRAKPPSTTFGIADEEEKEKLIEDHLLRRDLRNWKSPSADEDPVDPRVLAEESHLLPRERPSQTYLSKDNDGFFSNVLVTKDAPRLTSETTLLDRLNQLRLNKHNESAASLSAADDDQPTNLDDDRMKILKTMQQMNDRIADRNDQKRKYLHRIKSEKSSR